MWKRESGFRPGLVPGSYLILFPLSLFAASSSLCQICLPCLQVYMVCSGCNSFKGAFRREDSLLLESSKPAPVASFPSEVSPAGELEFLCIFANSFLDPLSKHIKMPVKIFAALLNLSGRLNWGENGNT